ncbi:hypothetical protein [Archangium sp.]|uniref:hypothetical protein n=1 Tax=Archangium sp. TaxID=1872627 RepID=UPI00286C4E54|nr:hypothetical protein [Archangium sp.]
MSARRTVHWTFIRLFLASALLTGCASGPQRSARRSFHLDSATAARLRAAATVSEGATALAPVVATQTVASSLVVVAPVLITLLKSDNAVNDFQARLEECARLAEREVNSSFFGNRSPTRAECGEEVDVDGCGRITRAMLLGQRKHVRALQCARELLEQHWPAPFSIEQRYRYYQHAEIIETVSREQEADLIARGCTPELWRTIKPDLVLHADRNLLRSVLTLDFKFPCPDTNEPKWTEYGEKSAYTGSNQGKIYKKALGGEALLISPQTGVVTP